MAEETTKETMEKIADAMQNHGEALAAMAEILRKLPNKAAARRAIIAAGLITGVYDVDKHFRITDLPTQDQPKGTRMPELIPVTFQMSRLFRDAPATVNTFLPSVPREGDTVQLTARGPGSHETWTGFVRRVTWCVTQGPKNSVLTVFVVFAPAAEWKED